MHVVEPPNEPPNEPLSAALRALRDDEREWGASPDVEARLLSAVRTLGVERRRARMMTLAAAAVLVLAIAGPLWRLARSGPAAPADERRQEVATAFFPLVEGQAPDTTGRIVRLEVPRSALALFGLDTPGREAGGTATVLADVLVSDDGLARAVRFVGR